MHSPANVTLPSRRAVHDGEDMNLPVISVWIFLYTTSRPHLRKQDVRCFIENQNNLQTRHYCPPAPSSSLDDVFRQLLMYGRDNFSDNLLQVRRRSLSASKHSACIIVFWRHFQECQNFFCFCSLNADKDVVFCFRCTAWQARGSRRCSCFCASFARTQHRRCWYRRPLGLARWCTCTACSTPRPTPRVCWRRWPLFAPERLGVPRGACTTWPQHTRPTERLAGAGASTRQNDTHRRCALRSCCVSMRVSFFCWACGWMI